MGQREETTEELSERVLARLRREYCEGDRNMLAATSSDTGMTADETLIEGLCILPAFPNEKPIRKHVIVTYMADGSEIYTKPITYCPFCGRDLKEI